MSMSSSAKGGHDKLVEPRSNSQQRLKPVSLPVMKACGLPCRLTLWALRQDQTVVLVFSGPKRGSGQWEILPKRRPSRTTCRSWKTFLATYVFAQFFTFTGVLLAPVCLLGGVEGTWVWYAAAALLLGVSLLSAIQWRRLFRRRKKLQDRGVKPDFGKPPELEGVKGLLRE